MGQPPVAVSVLPDPVLQIVLGGHRADSPEGAARLAFWQAATGGNRAPSGAIEARLAADVMALFGKAAPKTLLARRAPMLDRAASALRAAGAGDQRGLRRKAGPQDVICRLRCGDGAAL